jgi:serine/threonine protein kinase
VTSAVPPDLASLLGDRYKVERQIARGGMATVYLAKDLRHDRDVALKVMHREIALALGRERFLREIKLAARLSHPNILTVHDSGEMGDRLWYVMPYVEGESLRDRLNSDEKLGLDEAVSLTREAADALGYAHSLGIVHRDIKPENILISRGHAVIADFGIARAIDVARDDALTTAGVALGTTAYMSPEQALGEGVHAGSDVWALGCVLYEMLAGKPPFGTGGREVVTRALTGRPVPLRALRLDVSEDLERIVEKALAREKTDRYANASALAEALDSYRAGRRPRIDRKHLLRIAGVGIAAAIVIALGARMMSSQRDTPAASPAAARPMSSERLSSDSTARELYKIAKVEQLRRTAPSMARAIALFSQVIARDSSYAPAWARLAGTAQISYLRGYLIPGIPRDSLVALAVAASARAIELGPDDASAWLVKGRVSRLVDPVDNGPVLFAIRKSLAIDSTDASAWYDLGMAEQESLNDSAARAAWLRSAELNPGDVQTLAFIALHYLWNDEYDLGLKWADSAIKLDPTYQVSRIAAGQINVALGRPLEAMRHIDVVLRLATGREKVNALSVMAKAQVALGDRGKARETLAIARGLFDMSNMVVHEPAFVGAGLAAVGDTAAAVQLMKAYSPRGDLHYQLHLKRDPGLRWLRGAWGKGLLVP